MDATPAPGVEPAAKAAAAACEATTTPFAFAVAASGLRFLAGDDIAAADAAAAFASTVAAPAAFVWSHGRLNADASEAALFSCFCCRC